MKKIFIFLMFTFLGIVLIGCGSKEFKVDDNTDDEQKIDSQISLTMTNYIDSLITKTDSYIPAWNKESFKGRWNYIDGVFLNSIVTLYYDLLETNEAKANEYKNFFLNYINYYIASNGSFLNLKDSSTSGFKEGELDSICESKILFDAYTMTKDSRYLNAINITKTYLLQQPRALGTNNFSHKTSYLNQIWLDGMYMYGPFYARYASAYNDSSIFTELKGQYKYIRDNMFDTQKKLYYHGHDTTKSIFWANKETGNSPSFWLRSMGWYLVSLCDVLDYYPEGNEKQYLIDLLKEALDGILQYQDTESKMFYQVIDKKNITVTVPGYYLAGLNNKSYMQNGIYVDTQISNYLEASGSSMIAYALIKAANNGYIAKEYKAKGIEVFEGVYNHSFKNNHLNDICITAGLGPENRIYRDGTIAYYLAEPVGSDDAKGVGPFIMAYLEYAYGSSRKSKILTSINK